MNPQLVTFLSAVTVGTVGTSKIPKVILIAVIAVVGIIQLVVFLTRYKRCPSNKLMVITGKLPAGKSMKVIHGGAAFVWPLIQQYDYLDLEPYELPVELPDAVSADKVRAVVNASVIIAIDNAGEAVMERAAERLMGMERTAIERLASDLVDERIRKAVDSMTWTEIEGKRQLLVDRITAGLNEALAQLGMAVISVNVKSVEMRDKP